MDSSNDATEIVDCNPTCIDPIVAGTDRRDPYHRFELTRGTLPSEAVADAVASLTDSSLLDLDPLYASIDPDALDELCTATGRGPSQSVATIRFAYADHVIVVRNGGPILVRSLRK